METSPSPPFEGLVAAVHTPFGPDGDLATDVVAAQAKRLATDGITAVFVGGTTGEGSSLSAAERLALFEAWADVGPKVGLRVIAHVGGNAVRECVSLARETDRIIGIEAVAAIAPCFLRPSTPKALALTIAEVLGAAPSKPGYYYDIPPLTGITFTGTELAAAFREFAPELRGIKCSRDGEDDVRAYLDAGYDVLYGCDESLVRALALGVRGAVGSTYNYAAPLVHRMIAAFDAGEHDEAARLQALSLAMIERLAADDYLPACRLLMERRGVPLGPPRLPLLPLGEERIEPLRRDLVELGLADDLGIA